MITLLFASVVLVTCMFSQMDANAFKLDPYSHRDKETGIFQDSFVGGLASTQPIHENLTIRAITTSRIPTMYVTDEFLVNVIKGVRWNDDPFGLAKGREATFYFSYTNSCSIPEVIDPDWDLLYRTHCGDMQFLHSMASSVAELSINTRKKILMWLEFAFKVATGAINKDRYFRSLDIQLDESSAEEFRRIMTNHGKTRMMWQPEWLFTLDCDRWFTWRGLFFRGHLTELTCKDLNNRFSVQTIQDIALGSLLHVIQDSFSASHVQREGGQSLGMSKLSGMGGIIQFGNYFLQDHDHHGLADICIDENRGESSFDLTEISAKVIELVIGERLDKRERWSEAKQLFEEVFYVLDPDRPPGGLGYQ